MNVVTRFPPSPTGFFHIGSARTALFNYLFARHCGGQMYLRFEDTDKARSKKEYEEDILAGLAWLGIEYSTGPALRQSERTDVYKKYLTQLIETGAAYEAEAAADDPTKKVIRFKNPGTTITFTDLIRGEVTFDTAELKDFVIAKGIEEPLYHLAVVADDHDMGITHVIRGEDHISNTPRQILILEALGFARPRYAHIPLILAPDRSKLSKRHGAVSINEYRALGYLPEALVNYLALLGWNPGGERELFSLQELAERFVIEEVHKGGAVFDIEKLKWFNREYLLRKSEAEFAAYALPPLRTALRARDIPYDERAAHKVLPLLKERVSLAEDISRLAAEGEWDFIFVDPAPELAKIPEKKSNAADASRHLSYARGVVADLSDFSAQTIKSALWEYASTEGRGAVLWPLRYALTGRDKSPEPFTVAEILGKDSALRRIDFALKTLSSL